MPVELRQFLHRRFDLHCGLGVKSIGYNALPTKVVGFFRVFKFSSTENVERVLEISRTLRKPSLQPILLVPPPSRSNYHRQLTHHQISWLFFIITQLGYQKSTHEKYKYLEV